MCIYPPITVLTLGLPLIGCGLLVPNCTSALKMGIDVRMVDSVSGVPVIANDIFATATKANYADTVTDALGTARFQLVEDRAGTYTVFVRVPGYADWQMSGIRVEPENECHVRTTDLTVNLQAALHTLYRSPGLLSR